MIKKVKVILMLFFVVFLVCGCARKSTNEFFVRPEFNLGYVRTVAVLPFEDTVGKATIAAHCRQITINQILSSGLFEVVEKMQVDSVLHREAIGVNQPIDASELRRLGQLLGVQGFILGSLNDAGQQQTGAAVYPELSLTMRLIDSESGLVLWHASGRESGYTIWGRLFGVSFEDSYQATTKLIRRMLRTIGQRTEAKS